jgi:hypothetical protein
MLKEECKVLWEGNESVDHPDVSLPHGWHLNHARVPIPPPLEAGPKLDAEISHRVHKLPHLMRYERMHQNPQFWYHFLAWEHIARRRSTFHDEYQPWDAYPVEDSSFPTRKMRMTRSTTSSRRRPTRPWRTPPLWAGGGGALPPGAEDLPPEYQVVAAVGYDEEALLQ